MTESEKPDGDLADAEDVTVDEDGNVEMDMEPLEFSEGEGSSGEE